MIYLNLSSSDSLSYYPDNVWFDFTVELPRAIEGRYDCALLEFFTSAPLVEDLYIFTGICEPEFVHDAVLPLLRIVSEPGELSTPFFKRVSRQVIQRVHIYIRDKNMFLPKENLGPVRITLGLEAI